MYRAYDTLLDWPVALKVLSATGLGTEGRARLVCEARAVAKLNHPNIMAIDDAGEAGVIPLTYARNHGLLKPWGKRFPISPIKTTYVQDIVMETP